jgi:methyltransferase (TIGR00027 family)
MKPGRPSVTAMYMALCRAAADRNRSVREFSDPIARALLPDGWLRLLGLLPRLPGSAAVLAPLRTVAIDEALRRSVAPQLVVLGAGLDSRAWRMRELAATVVFEVDHPATQAYKVRRVDSLRRCARAVHFVDVDFDHDRLERCLADAGHDSRAPTFWIWEGVIPYLSRDAFLSTLAAVAARSALGSRLAATYGDYGRGDDRITRGVVALLGEPFRAGLRPEEMAGDLARVGMRVVSDTDGLEWAERWSAAPGGRRARYLRERRLVIAERVDP